MKKLHLSSARFTLFVLSICMVTTFLSCDKEKEGPEPAPQTVKIPFEGSYSWHFTIPSMGDQVSTHIFYTDSIVYKMEGSAYSTEYIQMPVSYDDQEKRLVTVGKGGSIPKDGVYFVMFFKDIEEDRMTIYKRECISLEEANTLSVPPAGAVTDHGWNVYIRE